MVNLLPLQFALAGMNAHINRDLPAAIVATYGELGGVPSEVDPRYTISNASTRSSNRWKRRSNRNSRPV